MKNMAEITAATVKELRERTGAGMMDCKKALAENNGDMEAAIDWLRAKGLAAAAKKAGRTAAEGLVGVAVEGKRGAVVEVNSETDFVAKNEHVPGFRPQRRRSSRSSTAPTSRRSAHAAYPGGGTVEREADRQHRHDRREPVAPPRRACSKSSKGAVVSYVHNAVAPGLGKIGVLVALESAAPADALERARQADRDAHRRGQPAGAGRRGARRRRWSSASARSRWRRPTRAASRPNIVEKMVEGAIAKFRKENALLSQLFVMDNKTPVADVVAAAGKDAGTRDHAQGLSSASSSAKASRRRTTISPPKSRPPPAQKRPNRSLKRDRYSRM